jgi:putative ATPase
MACEDVGPADPAAVTIVEACAAAFDRVGLPEGQFHLAHAAVYLSTCPKSNSLLGYFDARQAVEEEEQGEVPAHLKDGSRDKGLGHGAGYIYPHSYRDHWAAQPYLPQNMREKLFYNPSDQGYERKIRDQVLRRRELQLSAMGEADRDEVLTVSPEDRKKELWLKRISETRIAALKAVRFKVFSGKLIKRHHRVMVSEQGSPFLLWEALRMTPEGLTAFLNSDQEKLDEVEEFTAAMAYPEKPMLLKGGVESLTEIEGLPSDTLFEHFIGRNVLPDRTLFAGFFQSLPGLLVPSGYCTLAQTVPGKARPISELLSEAGADKMLTERIEKIDRSLRSGSGSPLLNWDGRDLTNAALSAGFTGWTEHNETFTEPRVFREKEIRHWFSRETGMNYGALLRELYPEKFTSMIEEIVTVLKETEFQWPRTYLFFTAHL